MCTLSDQTHEPQLQTQLGPKPQHLVTLGSWAAEIVGRWVLQTFMDFKVHLLEYHLQHHEYPGQKGYPSLQQLEGCSGTQAGGI